MDSLKKMEPQKLGILTAAVLAVLGFAGLLASKGTGSIVIGNFKLEKERFLPNLHYFCEK